MMNTSPKDSLQIITNGARLFEKNFVDKNMLIIYKDDSNAYKSVETIAYRGNYCHLTGVETSLSSNEFFERAKNSKLSNGDYKITETGEAVKKLSVMEEAMEFTHNAKMTGYFSPISSKHLYTEMIVGNVRFALGFVKDEKTSGKYYVPNTLLNGDVKNFVGRAYPIEAIFEKSVGEDLYSNLVHISKKHKDTGILSLPLSKSIKKFIAPYIQASVKTASNEQEEQQIESVKKTQQPVDDKKKNNDMIDLVAATMVQCGDKLDIEIDQYKNTQKENNIKQVQQVGHSQQFQQVEQVRQAQQARQIKQKTKSNNGASGKR